MNEAGFYKNESGTLLFGPTFVLNATYELRADNPADRTRTVDGWAWYDTEAEARAALGLVEPTLETLIDALADAEGIIL